ncbi:Flp family type IVb pilin [Altererythrobacter litoralis]|uniref:Flp family type IVb pilin n=1 Tax=Altererythrobacter litoralis TaxID=3113904 RepID=A0ABU7GHG9_9SPHN|nr:Flp family type IVb pilin [Erythrobacteraceae bacterium 1XM1-14]
MKLSNFLKRIGIDNSGATAVEYGLIVSLIVIACIGGMNTFANSSDGMWTNVTNRVSEVVDRQP